MTATGDLQSSEMLHNAGSDAEGCRVKNIFYNNGKHSYTFNVLRSIDHEKWRYTLSDLILREPAWQTWPRCTCRARHKCPNSYPKSGNGLQCNLKFGVVATAKDLLYAQLFNLANGLTAQSGKLAGFLTVLLGMITESICWMALGNFILPSLSLAEGN